MNTVNKDRYSLGLRLTYDYDNYKNNFQFVLVQLGEWEQVSRVGMIFYIGTFQIA